MPRTIEPPKRFYMNHNYSKQDRSRGELKYPFDKMTISDYLITEPLFHDTARSCAYSYAKKSGKKFKITDLKKGKFEREYKITRVE